MSTPWFSDVPPFPGAPPWEISNNSGGAWANYNGAAIPEIANQPAGTQRFRRQFVVPPGVTEDHFVLTLCGDLVDADTNDRPKLYLDGVFFTTLPWEQAFRCSSTAIPMSMLPAGPHTIEVWQGATGANAGSLTLTNASASFPGPGVGRLLPSRQLPAAKNSCHCCSRGGVDRCYYDNSAVRVATFDDNRVTANPSNFGISGIPNSRNGNYSGLAATLVNVPNNGATSGIEFDFLYVFPRDRVLSVRITTNYGNFLNDNDNIFNPTAQLFDASGAPLTAPFVAAAANGGGFFTTPVPGAPIDGVARLHLSDIKGNAPSNPTTVGIREVELLIAGIGPASLIFCPHQSPSLSWVDPRTGVAVPAADLTDCR